MIGISIVVIALMLGGCNSGSKETFEQALQKEIDRRVAAGELAYPEEVETIVVEEESAQEELVGYDLEGNPVEIDGVDVVQSGEVVLYRLGGLYPPGEYVAVANDDERMAYYAVSIDPEGEIIVTNGSTETSVVFDTLDGEYIQYEDCKIYPIDKAPEVKKTAKGAYPESTYKVGAQIPAGEYVVKGNAASATIYAYLDPNDSDSKLSYWSSNKCVIVTVKDGEYLEAVWGDIYPIEDTADLKPADGIYKDGMYKVGFHMPAGTYKLTADVDTGYAEIYSSNTGESGRDNLIVAEPETTFTVKEGQYVTIAAGKAVLNK